MDKYCHGCGAALQSERQNEPGYVPLEVLQRTDEEDIICRRCYRIRHYGQDEPVVVSRESYLAAVTRALNRAGMALIVLDVIDFEGSFDPALFKLAAEKKVSIGVLANKMDLLPPKVPRKEAERWVSQRLADRGFKVAFVQGVSGKSGQGFDRLLSHMAIVRGRKPAAIIGVTNVGKSSVIRQLLQFSPQGRSRRKPDDEKQGPLVSRFAGTTLGTIDIKVPDLSLKIIDTPGLVPEGRVSDMVCGACRESLVPDTGLAGKLFELRPGKAVLFGSLASITNTGTDTAVVSVYSSEGVTLHETSAEKAVQLLADRPDWLKPNCSECIKQITHQELDVAIRVGEDLAFSGLGWVSVRKADLKAHVSLPQGTAYRNRPNLIGEKNRNR